MDFFQNKKSNTKTTMKKNEKQEQKRKNGQEKAVFVKSIRALRLTKNKGFLFLSSFSSFSLSFNLFEGDLEEGDIIGREESILDNFFPGEFTFFKSLGGSFYSVSNLRSFPYISGVYFGEGFLLGKV